jgi:hypothetical protein
MLQAPKALTINVPLTLVKTSRVMPLVALSVLTQLPTSCDGSTGGEWVRPVPEAHRSLALVYFNAIRILAFPRPLPTKFCNSY